MSRLGRRRLSGIRIAVRLVAAALLALVVGHDPIAARPDASPRAGSTPGTSSSSSDWTATKQAAVAQSEYSLGPVEGLGGPDLQAPNRAHGFRTSFEDGSVRIRPRAATGRTWELRMRLARVGRSGALEPAPARRLSSAANRAEYAGSGIDEWFVNDERGLEQGFTLTTPPGGGPAPLHLELALSGDLSPRLSDDATTVTFEHEGEVVLSYAGLRSWDARGRDLPSRMELRASGGQEAALSLIVDADDAEYPVTVDPLVTSPAWVKDGGQAGAQLGGIVASAGDVNGDGYADVLLGAPYFDTGSADAGRALVYHGSATGPSSVPDWTSDGSAAGALYGVVAGAGDVNGDGYDDVIVGSPLATNTQTNEGSASVFLGGPSGLSATPVWTAWGNQATAYFGYSVAGAGDVNGDGYADVIVGAPEYDNGEPGEGRVFVYPGSASGPGSTPWTAESNYSYAFFGGSVTGGGDVNRDGFADIAVGAPFYSSGTFTTNGQFYVYHGSATGLPPSASAQRGPSTAPTMDLGRLGSSIASAGDVDGDGYADLLVGEPGWGTVSANAGRATLYRGGPGGIGSSPTWTSQGTSGSYFGLSVASAGDVNGDGYADWVVGAPLYDSGSTDSGYAYVYQGVATASLPAVTSTSSLTGNQAGGQLGMSVASAGDVNGDGLSDVLAGANMYDGTLTDEGRVTLHYGQANSVRTTPVWRVESNTYGGRLGWAVAAIGDVNGDGYADVAGGAPRIGNGSVFVYHGSATGLSTTESWLWSKGPDYGSDSVGRAVSSADVNGDGYSDLVVGDFNWSNPDLQEGRVFVFNGSPSGLPASPSWVLESNVASSQFGMSVTGVGDVNGDGYEDVLVGAPFYSGSLSRQGAVFLFLGSPTGLQTTFSWFFTGDQVNAYLGAESSLGVERRAGDVNGDGYADIVLGQINWSSGQASEGRVALFYGGPSGPSFTPDWTFESNQAGANLGIHPTTAGDVNGDGFADLVTGASGYDNGQTDEGRVFVFHGGPGGLPPGPSWTWEPNSASARIGRASGLGDVNADGFADLIVYSNGYVFLGSPTGLTSSYLSTSATPLATGAGDVDGDGFGEVLRAWDQYTSGGVTQIDEGALYIHSTQPSAAGGRRVLARMLRGGSAEAPVQPWGRAYHAGEFRVRMNSTSSRGRGLAAKLEVEACLPAVAFGSAGCARAVSADWTELTAASGATDTLTLTGLASRTLYRWRVRTLYAPATVLQPGISPPPRPAHGPWRRVFAQAREGDVRTDQGITVSLAQATATVSETNVQMAFGATMTTSDGQPNLYPVTVQYQTADGTATAGSDYTAAASSITWSPGAGSAVTEYRNIVLAGGDGISEGPETFSIGLSSPVNAALAPPTVEVVTISDSDPVQVAIADTAVVEGDSGTATASFTVNLSYASETGVSVSWATVGGSASPGSDFVAASGALSFAPLQTSRTVEVAVNGDALDEGDETFQVVLSSPVGAAPGDMTAVGTIENDDGPTGDAVTIFAATARNARVDLEWVYPAARDTVRIRYTEGATCTAPTDPDVGGTLLGEFSGQAGAPDVTSHPAPVNGTQYCYRIWTVLGANTYAAGSTTHARPIDNSAGQPGAPIAWAYTTGASDVAPPAVGGDLVVVPSNDTIVHAVVRGSSAGAGLWPAGYEPRVLGGPVQHRPALIPLPVVPGSAAFTLLGSQDGSVYAVDGQTGTIRWKTPLLPAGTAVQGAPSAIFAAYGGPYGVDFDRVVVGTRNASGSNRFYALDAASGATVGLPYDNGGGASDIGFVSGSATIDYPTKRAYFTSRASGSLDTLWCFDLSGSGLSFAWATEAGDIDVSPVLRGNVVYTSTTQGDVMAYRADDGDALWKAGSVPTPLPTEAGGVKGFIFADRLSQALYFSTTNKVWAVRDDGSTPSVLWSTTDVPSPSTLVFLELGGTGYVFVGGGDGRLYQLDAATGTQVKSVQLGGLSDHIGAPTLDVLNSMAYVGSAAGVVYAVGVPLP